MARAKLPSGKRTTAGHEARTGVRQAQKQATAYRKGLDKQERQRTKNMMLRGGGADNYPQDRGSWQSAAAITSNPYFNANYFYRWQEWTRWYYTDWAARKVVDIPVQDMFRVPHNLKGLSADEAQVMKREFDRLKAEQQFIRGMKQQRLLGGCALYMGVADTIVGSGGSAEMPLASEVFSGRPDSFRCINLVDIPRISRDSSSNDELSEDFDKIQTYRIDGRLVDRSRLVIFDGEDQIFNRTNLNLLQPFRINPGGFGESILTPLYDSLIHAVGTQQGAYHLVNMSSVIFAAMKDFTGVQSTKPGRASLNMMAELIQSINMYRGFILNGQGVDIKQHSASFGSVPELVVTFLQILSAGSDIPATRFLGQAPGGLNATGESDLENYYNSIGERQTDYVKPRLMQIYNIIGVSIFGTDKWAAMRAGFDIQFPPLWNASEKEQSETAMNWINAFMPLVQEGAMTIEDLQGELRARRIFLTNVELSDLVEQAAEVGPDGEPIDPKSKLKEFGEQGDGKDDEGGESPPEKTESKD